MSSAAFLGVARNCGHSLPRLLEVVETVGAGLADWSYVFLESDSLDDTFDVLERFDGRHRQRGIVRSLGTVRPRFPSRTVRLAYLRNHCLRLLEERFEPDRFKYWVVMDLDGVNHLLDPDRLLGALSEPAEWGGLFANQSERYHDVWALRHPEWSPDDCYARIRGRPSDMSEREAYRRFVEARQVRIDPGTPLIEVDSAFGGLGIYRADLMWGCEYAGVDAHGEPICEHVTVNTQVRAKGGRLYIDPSLINGTGTRSHKAPLRRRARFWLRYHIGQLLGRGPGPR